MKSALFAAAFLTVSAVPALSQGTPPAPPAGAPAAQPISRVTAFMAMPGKAKLTVTTPGWMDGGDIPFEYTTYRTNTFPGVNWTSGPAGTKSYALIMQDSDGRVGLVQHFSVFNIPASMTKLDRGMTPTGNPAGSFYGPNYQGPAHAYTGPRTPAGPKHHYHLQVFALDTTLDPSAAGTIDQLTAQMKDHVLAAGEVVGLGTNDPDAPPPAPRGGAGGPPGGAGGPPPAAPPAANP